MGWIGAIPLVTLLPLDVFTMRESPRRPASLGRFETSLVSAPPNRTSDVSWPDTGMSAEPAPPRDPSAPTYSVLLARPPQTA